MEDEVMVSGTEGIVATPKQEQAALDNRTYFGDPLGVKLSAYNPDRTKKAVDKSFIENSDWRSFLADPYRNVKPDLKPNYRTYRQLEKMYHQPEFQSIVEQAGSDMAVCGQLLSDYIDWDKVSSWDKTVIGVSSARTGLKIGAAKTKVAQLEHDGAPEAEIAKAKQELLRLEQYAQHNTRPFESDTANALASFYASFERVIPETIATSAAIAALPLTGGASSVGVAAGGARIAMTLGNALRGGTRAANIIRGLKAARATGNVIRGTAIGAANFGIIYGDTYRVTMGERLDQIKTANPNLTDDEAYILADKEANLEAALEATPALLGLGFRGAIGSETGALVQGIVHKVPTDVVKRAKFMKLFTDGVNQSVGKKVAAGIAKDAIVDTLQETVQQIAENASIQLAEDNGSADELYAATLSRLGGFISDPLNEEYSDELNTLLTTLPAAAVFGGIAPTISYAGNKMMKGSVGDRLTTVFKNQKFGADLNKFTQENGDKMGAPALKEFISGMGSRGDAPTSVYFDKTAVKELADTDSEFREAMDRLGVLKELRDSEGNGGVIEIPLADYNEVVNGEKSGALYQKVKDMVTFQTDALTMSQLNEWLASVEMQNKKEIKKALEDPNSVYNQTLREIADTQGMTEDQLKANATLMQLVSNRVASSFAKPITGEQWFEQNVLLTHGMPEVEGLAQKTLDNATQPVNIETQIGAQNGQTKSTGQKTTDAIRSAISAAGEETELSGLGGHPLLHGRIWNDAGRGTKGSSKAKGVRVLKLNPKAKSILSADGVDVGNLTVLDGTVGNNAEIFRDAIAAAKDKLGNKAAAVDVKEISDYNQMKTLILSEDKQTGVAVKEDGDVVSVFNSNTERPGGVYTILRAAIENGGKKLDCFDTFLPRVYSRVGFKAVARNNWVEMYKPEGWNKEFFSMFNNGEPDVVFMVFDPAYYESKQEYKKGEGELINTGDPDADYGAGATAQDEAIKQIETESQVQYQKNKDVIAGWFDVIDGKYVVGLTDNWNATTFSHEVFHLYSRALQDNYNAGTMTEYWKRQTEKLFKSVEAKPNKDGQIKLTKNQEELLAERFTTYLLENEIQNPELNSIFAFLRDAFRKTYLRYDMQQHHPDKKTKEAFAVIFGAQDVAIAEQRALGLLEIPKPASVSQEAYDHYMSFILESRAKATHDMVAMYYRVEKYKGSKEYATAYDAAYTANLKAVEQESTFQVKAIAKQIGSDNVQDILLAYNNSHTSSLLTAEDVVAALNDTSEATQVAEARTAEAMDAMVKEKFNIKDNQTLVSKDLINPAMAKAFLMEALMAEGKDWKDFDAEYSKLLKDVDAQIQKMPLSRLQNSRRWKQLESVYAQQYQMYTYIDNRERAATVRRQQAQVVLIQNKMFEMNNRVDRFLEKFPKKLRVAQPQGKNVMSAESWDLLQSLMEQYGFKISDRRRSPEAFNIKLDKWLANIEESEYCPISNLRYFMPETAKGHEGSFGSMTVREFEVLEHTATAINSVASREYNLITEAEKVKYDTLVALTAKRFQEKGIKPYDENDTWVRKNLGILSNIVTPEPVLKAFFPEEVQRLLVRPFFTAAAKAEVDFNKWSDAWNNMTKGLRLDNTKKTYSTGHVLTYNQVANLLLAMGTEHAYENWRLFLKTDEAQAEAIVAEAIAEQPRLVKFANDYWKLMAETTEIMNTSYRKRYNKLFVKKEPRAFKIGQHEFTGGYVAETKLVSELPDNAGWESILMGELQNEKLLSDKPDGRDLQSIIDNTRGRLRLFARWGHVAPEFNNLVKFISREDVGATIGSRAQNYFKKWLRDYHTPAGDSAGLMHALMSMTTSTVLGFRMPQALLQLSGFIPAIGLMGRHGVRYLASGLARSLQNDGLVHQVAKAKDKSDYMAARYADPVKTLFGVSKTELQISKVLTPFQKIAMSMISYMDAIVSNATWEANYSKSIDEGLSVKEAKEKADQAVRLSQTDSLSASRARAMKSDWARIITPFSTYMMGMQSVVRGRIAEKDFYGAFGFAMSYTLVSTLLESLLKEMPYPWEDDDDEKYIDKVLKRWYNDSIGTAGSTLYPIANLGQSLTKSVAWATETILYPDEKQVTEIWGSGSIAALSYAQQYPDAIRYGMVGIFTGDEDAQRKAIANFVGWFSAGGKRMVKDLMDD